MSKAKPRLWEPAEHLESEEDMAAYLEAVTCPLLAVPA